MSARQRIALVLSLACAVLILAGPPKLWGHAVLVESSPKAGSTVKGPDVPFLLRFNVRVDGSRSRFTLVLPDGSNRPVPLDAQTKPDTLAARATGLIAGKYKLQWQVLAADGHISRGELSFTIQ